MPPRFATAINCIDGRAQIPVIEWVKLQFTVDFVDTITSPGADGALARGYPQSVQDILGKVRLSRSVHNPKVIVVAGHYDCLANPVKSEEHREHILAAANLVLSWGLGVRVVGAWVNEWSYVDLICDSKTIYRVDDSLQ